MASSNSPTSNWSAPRSRSRAVRSERALFLVSLHGLKAVERRRRHRPPGCAVDHQARAAETFELLDRRQHRLSVKLDGPVELVGPHCEPGGPHARTRTGGVVAVQDSDLPFVDRRAAAEGLGRLIANRPYLAGARTHRLFVLPRAGRNATTGATVDQQRHAKKAVDFLECGHDYIADVRDPGVDGRRLRLDSGRARVHETTLFARGQRPGGATGSTNHLPLAACRWQWAMPLRLFGNWQVAGNEYRPTPNRSVRPVYAVQSIRPARVPADGRAGARTRSRRAPRRPLRHVFVFLRAVACSLLRFIASRLSNDVLATARPDARSTSRLALQNPSSASRSGRTDVL